MTNHHLFLNTTVKYLLISVLLIFILYFGQTLFIPLFYGLFIAMVMYPVCRWLEKHRFSKSLAITVALSIVAILFSVLIWLLILQFNALRHDIPELKQKFAPALVELQDWAAANLNISIAAQNDWWQQTSDGLAAKAPGFLSGVLTKTISSVFMLLIIPVFAALFLYNRKDLILFFEKLAGERNINRIHLVLHKTIDTYFDFIKGMALVYILVGILNSIGLLALGIEHAILFGFLTAVMTIIPYFGIIIRALLPITVAWITKDSIWYPLGVIAVFAFVQYLEANIIFPRIVGKQLNISTWVTLAAVIAGGILWGVSGMILFIPLVAILKLITDDIPEMEAINVLIRRND